MRVLIEGFDDFMVDLVDLVKKFDSVVCCGFLFVNELYIYTSVPRFTWYYRWVKRDSLVKRNRVE